MTQEELKEFDAATYAGGLKGLAYGLGISVPGSLALQRWSPRYRALPPALKAFGIIMVTVPYTVILAERAGLRFDKERYSRSLIEKEEMQKAKEERAAENGNQMQRAKDWLNKNKYSVVVGSWAASMAAAWAVVNRDK